MTFSALQTRRFARQYKKLHDNVAADVDAAVVTVCHAPGAGERKKGDLAACIANRQGVRPGSRVMRSGLQFAHERRGRPWRSPADEKYCTDAVRTYKMAA